MGRVQLSRANLVSFREEELASNRRRPGRIRCERLRCLGGRVLDLSVTGARLEVRAFRGPLAGERRAVVFETAFGQSSPFTVIVRWARKVSRFRHELGVEFEGLDEPRLRQLTEIARVHAGRTVLGNIDRAA